jgi:hypothetical protein
MPCLFFFSRLWSLSGMYEPHELLIEEICDPQLLWRHEEHAVLPAPVDFAP